MPRLHWVDIQPASEGSRLRLHLEGRGHQLEEAPGASTALVIADRPDPALAPPGALDLLWWVKDATPEEVSTVLFERPGWVLRQDTPLEAVDQALAHLRERDLGSEGWLRQMLQLATLDELLRLVLVRALRMSGATHGAIWIRHGDTFFQRCGEGFPEAPLSTAQASEAVRTGAARLLCASEQVGLLMLRNSEPAEADTLGWIREVEPLLLTAWNLERTQALSFQDDLTVAQNRRCLEAELPRIVRDAASRAEALSLMFLDVDNLKALNSQFGHPTGSRVLTLVAEEAKRSIRAQDRLYRYGGDEFCIVVRGTPAQGAVRMAERLLGALGARPLDVEGQLVLVTISIGIADFPAHADGAERLLARADQALLKAKASGKARIVVAETP